MKLHQLSNGDWIDLATISAITAHEENIIVARNHLGAVIIVTGSNHNARQLRDELAALVNTSNQTGVGALDPNKYHPEPALAALIDEATGPLKRRLP